MRLLLDTHTLIWAVLRPGQLSEKARDALADTANEVLVSVVNVWEIGIKVPLGKLALPDDIEARIRRACMVSGFGILPVELRHAFAVRLLPLHHKDPFDRLLVAQAQVDGLALVTTDRWLRSYGVEVVW